MSTLRQNDQIKLAVKNRRKYLLLSVLRGLMAVILAVAGVWAAFGGRWMLIWAFRHQSLINGGFGDWMMGLQIGIVLTLFAGFSGFIAGMLVKTAVKAPYVPPVRQQIAAHAAKDVLVRGANQPTAAPDELVRAAETGCTNDGEQLLRAKSGEAI